MTRTALESTEPTRAERAIRTARRGQMPPERIRIEQHSVAGMLWFAGWLFSLGFLHLSFWKGVLALVLWPYYIGTAAVSLLH